MKVEGVEAIILESKEAGSTHVGYHELHRKRDPRKKLWGSYHKLSLFLWMQRSKLFKGMC